MSSIAFYPVFYPNNSFYSPAKQENPQSFYPKVQTHSHLDSYCENSTDDENFSNNGSFQYGEEGSNEPRNNETITLINNRRQKTIIDETKFKTEMCKNWQTKGFCNYEHKCKFAHGPHELNKKEFINRNLYKSKPCNSFHNKFFCPYGVRCLFIHQDRNLKQIVQKNYFTKKLNSLDFSQCEKTNKRLKFFEENSKKNENKSLMEDNQKKEMENLMVDKEIEEFVRDFL